MDIGYKLVGSTMILDELTTAALDAPDARDVSAVEREIRCDAQVIANETGKSVHVETSEGIELKRLGARP